jgi:hypothetical protein
MLTYIQPSGVGKNHHNHNLALHGATIFYSLWEIGGEYLKTPDV